MSFFQMAKKKKHGQDSADSGHLLASLESPAMIMGCIF